MNMPQFKKLMSLYQDLNAKRSWEKNDIDVERLSFKDGLVHLNFKKQEPRSGVKVGLMGDMAIDRRSFEYFQKYKTQFISFLFRKNANESWMNNIIAT